MIRNALIYIPLFTYTQMIPFQSRDTSPSNKEEHLKINRLIFNLHLAEKGQSSGRIMVWRTSVDLKSGAWTSKVTDPPPPEVWASSSREGI